MELYRTSGKGPKSLSLYGLVVLRATRSGLKCQIRDWSVPFRLYPHAVHGRGGRFKLHKTPREWRESGRGIIEQNGANSGKTSSTPETLKPAPVAGFSVFSRVFVDPLELVLSHQTRVRIPVALPVL